MICIGKTKSTSEKGLLKAFSICADYKFIVYNRIRKLKAS